MADNEEEIFCEKKGRCGHVTLNRINQYNAVNLNIIRQLETHYREWVLDSDIYGIVLESAGGKAFSAGGDLKAIYDWKQAHASELIEVFREEYQHNWSLELFNKPHIALIDGIIMGSGIGISIFGTHRVASEAIKFAMPEVGIGFFPDIGGGYFLSRFPGETGMYLGLTGEVIGIADAYYLGAVTHFIPSSEFDLIRNAMFEADPIDPVLERLHRDPGPSELGDLQPIIDRIFSAGSVEDILDQLDLELGDWADWAKQTAAKIRTKAPLSLKIAHRQIREGAKCPNLAEVLKMEFRLACRFLNGNDFFEGIRTTLMDKEEAPRWQPSRLEDVSEEMVEAYFAPLAIDELELVKAW